MKPSDPLYSQQWHFGAIGDIETIWDEYSGAGVHIGVYDNGFEFDHPDLSGKHDPSRNVVVNGETVTGEPNESEPDAHGTAVAGLISANANNGTGGIGVAWGASLTSVDVTDPSSPVFFGTFAEPNYENVVAAIHQMVNFDATNNSWNATIPRYLPTFNVNGTGLYAKIDAEYAFCTASGRGGLGTVIIQGVGNLDIGAQYSGLNASRFTITVGGIGQDGFTTDFSNYGACLLVTAPADAITTTDLTGSDGYATGDYTQLADDLGGTSFSGPIVTGVVALMLQANPNLGWRDVQNILAASATHSGSAIGATTPGTNENGNWLTNGAANWNGGGMHFSPDYGYGVVDAHDAVRMAQVWSLFGPAASSADEQFRSTGLVNFNDAISDDGAVNSYDLSIDVGAYGDLDIEHVDLFLNLQHENLSQLEITLISPDGHGFNLFDGSGGTDLTADSGFQWMFGVDGLRGTDVAGTWHVTIVDKAPGETGTLNWLFLTAYGAAPSTDDVYHYTDEFLAMAALAGESGRRTLSDAGGADWIDMAAATGNAVLNLAAGAATKVNGIKWFSIAASTAIENAVAGDGNDTVAGNNLANALYGMRGDDTLLGSGGNDFLWGSAGHDTLNGGNGSDTADFSEKAQSVSVTLAESSPATVKVKGVAEDTVIAIENVNGGAGADKLTGDTLANALVGGAGNDILKGGGAADWLDGGADIDSADYSDKTTAVIATAAGTTALQVKVGTAIEDTIVSIENLTGGSAGDTLTGNIRANVLIGNGGNDRLSGLEAADTLKGGAGDDVLKGGTGKDTLDGATGFDTADYGDKSTAVIATAAGTIALQVKVGTAIEDTIVSIENLIGGSAADTLTGNFLANVLTGNAGSDTLSGLDGADTLKGGGGQDFLDGGAGNDTFAYTALIESGALAAARDHIAHFAAGDVLNVKQIDADPSDADNDAFFLDNGNAVFETREIRQSVLNGTDLLVEFNGDDVGSADMSILLTGRTAFLLAGDFNL